MSTETTPITDWKDYEDTANKADVLRHLHSMGYEVTQRTFYRHCKQGKLHKNKDNIYSKRLVQQYVKDATLYRPGAVSETTGNNEDLITKKLRAEIIKLDEAGRREKLKRKKEEGKLIDREDLYLEVASRAVALDTGYTHMVRMESLALITAMNGDVTRQSEFEDLLLQNWNDLLDSYATTDEFEVLFEEEN